MARWQRRGSSCLGIVRTSRGKTMLCECGCKEELTGRQKRFRHDSHRAKYWSDARKRGAALGQGLSELIPPKPNGKPHCGHPGRSKRLARTLNVLMDAKGAYVSTLMIQ